MTLQEVIPGKKYRHKDFPDAVYVGYAAVNPETLDVYTRGLWNVIFGGVVLPPDHKTLIKNFWDGFYPEK